MGKKTKKEKTIQAALLAELIGKRNKFELRKKCFCCSREIES